MYNISQLEQLKDKFINAAHLWIDNKVNEFVSQNPKLTLVKTHLCNIGHNIIYKYENDARSVIDGLTYIADKNKNIDEEELVNTLIVLFNNMDEYTYTSKMANVTVGKGNICIDIPYNTFTKLMFGNVGKIKFNADDILELKQLIKK